MDDADDGTYSRPPTIEDVARICRALNEARARYVLIGGFAVIIHGSGLKYGELTLPTREAINEFLDEWPAAEPPDGTLPG